MRPAPIVSYAVPRRPQIIRTQAPGAGKPNIWLSTFIICSGLLATKLILPDGSPNQIFKTAAIGVGLSLALAFAIEFLAGLRAMLRTDILMLVVFYFLTFFEFLFPQQNLSQSLQASSAVNGTDAVLVGFASLTLGRHAVGRRRRTARDLGPAHLSPKLTMQIFIAVFVIGYFHIFYSVGFDLFEAIRQMQLPRFSQSWARGRLGGWPELLVEIGALIYLIPPLAGYVFARSKQFDGLSKLFVALVLSFTLFYGFSGGTRNILGVYAITLVGAFFIFQQRFSLKQVLLVGVPAFCLLLVAMYYMLEFRKVGISGFKDDQATEFSSSVFIDYNLVTISRLTEIFPQRHSYLGLEVPYIAIIRPIPRAIWHGKPEGLSLSVEDALGVRGYTLASTFVGEAYIAEGMIGVAIAGLLFGAAAARWNRMGDDVSSNFKLILYVSGFFCAAITMRSFMATLPAALPTIGLWFIGKLWIKQPRRKVLVAHPGVQSRMRR